MKKNSISNILVPVDFSETGNLALTHAANLAKLFNAKITVCHVMADYTHIFTIPEPVMAAPDIDEFEKGITAKLDELAEGVFAQHGIRAETFITQGRISTEIVNYAEENNVDLIVMGTHGAHGWEEFFIGSNAHKVVTRSKCPVLTVQTHAIKTGFKNIILPIDNSLHSRQKVDLAVLLAEKFGSHIHILGLLESNDKTDVAKFEIKLDSVEDVLGRHKIPFTRQTVRGNNLAVETLNYAKTHTADLIMIMTEHESDMSGMFLGPVARQIVNHSRVPVISIRPIEGYFEGIDLSGSSNPMAS